MHLVNTALLALCNFIAISHPEPDPDIHLHLYLPPESREGPYPENIASVRNCPDITLLIVLKKLKK